MKILYKKFVAKSMCVGGLILMTWIYSRCKHHEIYHLLS